MRILIVGAGSVGGYFGGRLTAAGRDVTFLVRPGRAEQLRRDGLRVTSPHGDLHVQPNLVETGDIAAPYDLILLGVKGFALENALDDFAPAVGRGTAILPVLNGMRHMDRLAERFGPGTTIGGVCQVSTELDRDGRIVQLSPVQKLLYGELDGMASPRMATIDAVLQAAGFDAILSPDIVQAMWDKWVMLASLGAACCLLRGAVGDIEAAPGGRETALALVEECAAIAAALGHAPSSDFLDRHRVAMTTAGSPFTSSMFRDLKKGRPVEADTILGDLVQRAEGAGIATPLLRAAYANLGVYSADPAKSER
jgi:2-dehydropantoate 2-reductase